MSDEQNVDAGSESSGATPAPEVVVEAPAETSSDTPTDAEGAAESTDTSPAPEADSARTDFADKSLRGGDSCICPDGRKGTVHSFDAGFVCIPNHDQSE